MVPSSRVKGRIRSRMVKANSAPGLTGKVPSIAREKVILSARPETVIETGPPPLIWSGLIFTVCAEAAPPNVTARRTKAR
jgi:hypothetical protein